MKILLFTLLPFIVFSQITFLDNVEVYLHHDVGFTLSATGDSVTTWADQSGNGEDGSPDIAARKPIYNSGGITVTEANDAGFTWDSYIMFDATSWGFSFWFKDYSGTSSDFVIGGAANGNIYFSASTNFLGFRDTGNNYNPTSVSSATLQAFTKYTHLVITSGGNTVSFYLDGVLVDEFDPTATTAIRFDAYPQGYEDQTTNSLNGTFTEFVCTSDSLIPTEVTQLYNLGFDGIFDNNGYKKYSGYNQ